MKIALIALAFAATTLLVTVVGCPDHGSEGGSEGESE